jgi:tetratricopeptide (TPR) repeat protein
MAMAYWGEAMTHNHPLWRGQFREKAMAVMQELGATEEERLDKAKSELERDLLKSIEILYGEGEKADRDKAYNAFYEGLYKKYPDNHEIAAFYGLSILGAVPVGRDEEMYGKGAKVVQSILKENPDHPGALHYLIHSYDDPGHAHLAKTAADRYAEVAPDAAHALHMPSHIYVALGLWDEVVRSNIASWNASVARKEKLALSRDAVSYHALHWMLYGYLQQQNHAMADSILFAMNRYVDEKPSITARTYKVNMIGNFLIETGFWNSPIANFEVDLDSLNIVDRTAYNLIQGIKDYNIGFRDFVYMTADRMRRERERAEMFVTEDGLPMCSALSTYNLPNRLDIEQSRVMEYQLRAFMALLDKDEATAEDFMQKAVRLEAELSYTYGPPVIVLPSFEQYAVWLSSKGRHEEAVVQYKMALERGPNRIHALQGLYRSALASGNNKIAQEVDKKLSEVKRMSSTQFEQSPNL